MPRFRGLTEVIRDQTKDILKDYQPDMPAASPLAAITGANLPFDRDRPAPTGILRWGFSTWGVDGVVSESKPKV